MARRSPESPNRLTRNAQRSAFNGTVDGQLRSARPVNRQAPSRIPSTARGGELSGQIYRAADGYSDVADGNYLMDRMGMLWLKSGTSWLKMMGGLTQAWPLPGEYHPKDVGVNTAYPETEIILGDPQPAFNGETPASNFRDRSDIVIAGETQVSAESSIILARKGSVVRTVESIVAGNGNIVESALSSNSGKAPILYSGVVLGNNNSLLDSQQGHSSNNLTMVGTFNFATLTGESHRSTVLGAGNHTDGSAYSIVAGADSGIVNSPDSVLVGSKAGLSSAPSSWILGSNVHLRSTWYPPDWEEVIPSDPLTQSEYGVLAAQKVEIQRSLYAPGSTGPSTDLSTYLILAETDGSRHEIGVTDEAVTLDGIPIGGGGGGSGLPDTTGKSEGDVLSLDGSLAPQWSAPTGGGGLKYVADIGDGSSLTYAVAHGLGSADVQVYLYENTGSKRQVFAEVQHTDANTATVVFSTAPSTDDIRVVVVG